MNHRGSAMEHLRGLFSITITPFHTDGTPDETTLAAQVERRLCRGI
jgi:dihydrodipicolinate synthase/N-acetylneuraminate lyase